ncbi:HAMP domain-containing histidine kinase [Paenibacillus athensensis]|uniref:histidine kinase n=1 Tax=Paenibacillus athensensis TaxID=1967502 RepID=A0A4Y8Q7I9_9BACL|nr:HAMP domain-containing sensor histidine kinase [Paenibacillus athensensis]MCD1257328.1 HAMP domain-containing histidine kinase [Paenibacillus athensensis]
MAKQWLAARFKSLYIKLFLSFLATCVLFFVGLGLFWNYYFTDLFYKDQKELLEKRFVEVSRLLASYQEGSISTRELNITVRLVARSINGQVWLVDGKGTMMNGSSEQQGSNLPHQLDALFIEGLKGKSGFQVVSFTGPGKLPLNLFTYYAPYQLNGQEIVVFLQVPVGEIREALSAVRINIVVPLLFSLVAVGVILFVLSRKLAGPLQQMNRAALELAGGDFSPRIPVTSQDEVGQLAASFNFMVEQLEEWEGARQEFLANVSHELRSPLTTLRGFIVAMNDKVIPPEKYPHYLQICDQEVQRLQRLVNDLLDLATIQNGVDVFRPRPLELRDKLAALLEVLQEPVRAKGLSMQLILPPPEQGKAEAYLDPDRFAQIVQNLIYNAIQFTPEGGAITVALDIGDALHVYVRDTGSGMSDSELERIWDRFYKADEARSPRPDGSFGTGLGLTIVKHLVGGMKGSIDVKSRLGEGTEFRVTFPRCP